MVTVEVPTSRQSRWQVFCARLLRTTGVTTANLQVCVQTCTSYTIILVLAAIIPVSNAFWGRFSECL